MKKLILLFVVSLTILNGFSQNIEKDLLKDIVVIDKDKFTAYDYTLLKLGDGVTTFQIKSYAEAPSTGVISRDNFVFIFSYLTVTIIEGLTEDPNATTDDLEEIIGNPDIEINLYMNKTGFQAEVKGPSGTNRFTQKWSDF